MSLQFTQLYITEACALYNVRMYSIHNSSCLINYIEMLDHATTHIIQATSDDLRVCP
jgi:hypothetical protein